MSYSIPLNVYDTTLRLWYQKAPSNVIDETFEELDISSEQKTYGIGLSHPVYRTPQQVLTLGG